MTQPSRSGSAKERKFRYMVVMCLLVVAPYTLFMLMLDFAPAALAWRPAGSSITLALYTAVVLFLWPIIMAIVFIKNTDHQ